ncbi:MAG: Bax inhibitor-1/YccA family protein [Treponema sp.]|nr:Bax inhibitor-1/YccA family protein [Treponema sp.]
MYNNQTSALPRESEQSRFMARTYGWMAFALFLSAVSAFVTATLLATRMYAPAANPRAVYQSVMGFFMVCAIAEIALVWWLSASIRRISVGAATIGFVVYSVLNGVTLSTIFFAYDFSSIAGAFFSTAITFCVMSLYGLRTKRNLMSFGRYLMMGVIGILIASLVQFVLSLITRQPLYLLDMLISVAVVVVFTALTAYDSQKILRTAQYADGSEAYKKVAILGALELYLDFINILLALLRLFGKRRS